MEKKKSFLSLDKHFGMYNLQCKFWSSATLCWEEVAFLIWGKLVSKSNSPFISHSSEQRGLHSFITQLSL